MKGERVCWGNDGRGVALSSDCLSEITRSEMRKASYVLVLFCLQNCDAVQ